MSESVCGCVGVWEGETSPVPRPREVRLWAGSGAHVHKCPVTTPTMMSMAMPLPPPIRVKMAAITHGKYLFLISQGKNRSLRPTHMDTQSRRPGGVKPRTKTEGEGGRPARMNAPDPATHLRPWSGLARQSTVTKLSSTG